MTDDRHQFAKKYITNEDFQAKLHKNFFAEQQNDQKQLKRKLRPSMTSAMI